MARVLQKIALVRSGVEQRARRAKEAIEQAVAVQQKVLPGNHPDLGRSLNNLGNAERSSGSNQRARESLGRPYACGGCRWGPATRSQRRD